MRTGTDQNAKVVSEAASGQSEAGFGLTEYSCLYLFNFYYYFMLRN